MSANSSSTESTPIVASISLRSASVTEVYRVMCGSLPGSVQSRVAWYSAESIRTSTSEGSVSLTFTSQPSPYGSSLIVSGLSASNSLTAVTSPDSGANTSETAFTDSTSVYASSLLTSAPTFGASKKTTSPRASWAYQVIPKVALSPSIRAQSCSWWYFRSSG